MRSLRRLGLAAGLLFGCRLLVGCGGGAPAADPAPVAQRACDLLGTATPCVAAYSTTRALYAGYTGMLYRVVRASDGTGLDVGLSQDGYADVSAEDSFCVGTTCAISRLYDQSTNHNDLAAAPPGGNASGAGSNGYDLPAQARVAPVMVGGHKAYGIRIVPGMGYRNDITRGIATGGQAEGMYMVTSALFLNAECCFDFGNAEIDNNDNGAGHMDAINIRCPSVPCTPTVNLDLENGLFGGLVSTGGTTFVTAMGSNDGKSSFTLYQGNAQSGALTSKTAGLTGKYAPLSKEGAIILGIGGDNSNRASGYFFEGVMTAGAPAASVLNAVQGDVVSAGYTGTLAAQ